jgi:hypothetical protein
MEASVEKAGPSCPHDLSMRTPAKETTISMCRHSRWAMPCSYLWNFAAPAGVRIVATSNTNTAPPDLARRRLDFLLSKPFERGCRRLPNRRLPPVIGAN